ncbi:MAG: caspase family protein [Methylococcales bacterium]|nr:caspase family protein [Methylococcales bacterium]
MNKSIAKLLVVPLLLMAQQTAAQVYGIVIGIDAYKNVNGLNGAVNDAKMVADALNSIASKPVTLLLDGNATRENIKQAWDNVSSQAKKGDTVFFTYAGHGSQDHERVKGTEADGMDEFYVLANFAVSGPETAERLVDDDLQEWFSKRPDLSIVLVSDSCHSGTMTRAYKKSKLKYRKIDISGLTDDALPVPTNPDIVNEQVTKMPHVISFAGVPDNEEVPEVNIENQRHGALSWSFAKGLSGLADGNGDGAVSVSELKNFLLEKVRMSTEGQQHPQISFVNDVALAQKAKPNAPAIASVITLSVSNAQANPGLVKDVADNLKNVQWLTTGRGALDWDVAAGIVKDKAEKPVFTVAGKTATKAYKRKGQPTEAISPQEFVKLFQPLVDEMLAITLATSQVGLAGGLQPIFFSIDQNSGNEVFAKQVVGKLSGIQLVDSDQAVLEWDVEAGVVRNQFNDSVYSLPADENQAGTTREVNMAKMDIAPETIGKLQAVINKFRLVEQIKLLSDGSLAVKLLPTDKLHAKGEAVTFEVGRLKYPYFTLINLAVDGTVNFLYPIANDPLTVSVDSPYKLADLEVSAPFGADHFVAIASDKPLSTLHETLKKLNNAPNSVEELRKTLDATLKDTKYQIGIHPSFTVNSL